MRRSAPLDVSSAPLDVSSALLLLRVYVPSRIYPGCHVTCRYLHGVKNKCGPPTAQNKNKKDRKGPYLHTKSVTVNSVP